MAFKLKNMSTIACCNSAVRGN